jgi:oligopeptide transport system substrate-binding protein
MLCIAILLVVTRVLLLAAARMAICLAAAWLMAACAPQENGLMVANGDDVGVLHPQLAVTSAEGRVMQALHAGLTRLNPKTLAVEPNLAEAVHSEQNGRLWRFKIRPGLHWSDGEQLLPADILRSWQRLVDPAVGAPYAEWLADAELSLDRDQLTVEFPQPKPQFGEMCAYQALAPVPDHADAAKVSSGPFRLRARRIRDRIIVEKNPYFWDAENVELQVIHFLTIESQFTALNLFLTGDIQYAPAVPSLAIANLRRDYPQEFQPTAQFASYFLRFNTTIPPFDEVQVRRAFYAALHPQAIATGVGGGRRPALGLVPPGIEGWTEAVAPAWVHGNQAAAHARSELPSLNQLPTVEYLYNSSELNRDVAEVLQQQWKQNLGLTVRLANQEWKTFLSNQKGLEYQISRSSWVGDYLDPLTFLEIFHSESGNNRTGWKNPNYDALLHQAQHAQSQTQRFAALQQAEQLLLDQAVIVPLFYENSFELVSQRITGFERNLRGYIDWSRLGLTEDGQ